ncbi:hypothetical protein IAT38_003381 [Cryptococcus sp. DSM 104549]
MPSSPSTTTAANNAPRPTEVKTSGPNEEREISSTQPRDLTVAELWAGWDPITKDMANDILSEELYRSGEFGKATSGYLYAWRYLLPYHATGLSPDDPLRAQLGNFESTVWANVSASFLALSKLKRNNYFHDMWTVNAFVSAWAAWDLREYASVSIVRNACLRAHSSQTEAFRDPAYFKAFESMLKYWKAQADALADVPKNTLFKDLPEEKRLPVPPKKVTSQVGPRMWRDRLLPVLGDAK